MSQAYQPLLFAQGKPYGETLNTTGDGASNYAFAGEWRDASGLDYLRARYYAPGQGRFITKDVWSGNLKGNITAEKVEIRSTGRVWGDVATMAFATEEGAFLRGKITMEEKIEWEEEGA
ncbi:MAG: polymer-forming cytoskeletal protein [Anaerolineales bacterium]|nr:polymer-forming cytoskeletal protein [Anaerolineales bacterium]